jgi:aspartate racemase
MNSTSPGITWGILGGLGPIASAHFLRTIYSQGPLCPEQERPVVIMLSDPTFPDRTQRILSGTEAELLPPLQRNLQRLVTAGASALAICCVTMHHWLPRVRPGLRSRVVSLLDLVFEGLKSATGPHLMLCSSGSRATALYERHPSWTQARHSVAMPDSADQEQIHTLICHLKNGAVPPHAAALVSAMIRKYRATGIIAGCTEIHLLTTSPSFVSALPGGTSIIDPLATLASYICTRSHAAGTPRAQAKGAF